MVIYITNSLTIQPEHIFVQITYFEEFLLSLRWEGV